jgi:hypothetical protein
MERRGEDPPTDEDIDYFGFYQACKNTRGEFAIFKNGSDGLAARGRTGSTPLFWNHKKRLFSFWPGEDLKEFPEGCMYNATYDRLVCWEPMYFDKPLGVSVDEAVTSLRILLRDAIEFRIDKCDAFLFSPNDEGSILIDSFLEPGTIDTIPTKEHKTFLSSLGCKELFEDRDSEDFLVGSKCVDGLELYSPFLDSHVMEYVLDMTSPDMRPRILYRLLYGKKYW